MKTLLTLDYEIFFGRRTGTVARCLLEPTEAAARVAEARGARLALFVDSGFLLRLRAEMASHITLKRDHDAILRQLERLARRGHELQLHIHPHWEDCRWDGDGWRMDLRRYALQAFCPEEIADIVRRYAGVLREIAMGPAAFAYRAGGWVVQPFAPIRSALLAAGVTIDSTVFAGGHSRSAVQPFDFRGAPAKSRWRFDEDPLVERPGGPFLELPIASRRIGPAFFWRLAALRKLRLERHRAYGDGAAIALESGDLVRKLVQPTWSVVSLDGLKASFLARAADEYRARGMEDFVAIGHPKALSPHSLQCLDAYLARRRDEVVGYGAYVAERVAEAAA